MRALLWKELREWGVPIGLIVLLGSLCWSLADWNDVFLGPDEGPTLALLFFGCPLAALFGWWQHRLELSRGVLPYLVHRSGGFARLFLAKCAVGFGGTLLLAWLPLVIAYSVKALTTPYGPIMQELRLLEYFWTSFGFATAYAAGVFVAQLRRGMVIESLLALLGGLGGLLVAVVVPPPALHVRPWTMPLYAALHVALGAGILWHAYRMFSRSIERETGPQSAVGGAAPVLVLLLWALPAGALLGGFWNDARNKLLAGYPQVVWDVSEQRYFAIDNRYPQPYHEVDESRRQLREIERDPSRIRYPVAYAAGSQTGALSSGPADPFADGEESSSTWAASWNIGLVGKGITEHAGFDPKLGRVFVWWLWQGPGDGGEFRTATRSEELDLVRPDGDRFSSRARFLPTHSGIGKLLLLDREDMSFWIFEPGGRGKESPSLVKTSLPGGDAFVRLERLYQIRPEISGTNPLRVGLLIVGRADTYEFGEAGIAPWIPDGTRLRASELVDAPQRNVSMEQTGAFAWRVETLQPSGNKFSFEVQPQTTSERLLAAVLSVAQLARPPIRPLTDMLTSFEFPADWGQRLAVFRSLFGPALPRSAQVLHLLVSLAGSVIAVWMLRRRGERATVQFSWGLTSLIGGPLTLLFLKLLAAPRPRLSERAETVARLAKPSAAGGVS